MPRSRRKICSPDSFNLQRQTIQTLLGGSMNLEVGMLRPESRDTARFGQNDVVSFQRQDTRVFRVMGKVGEIVQGMHRDLGPFFVSGAISASADSSSAEVIRCSPLRIESLTGGSVSKAKAAVHHFLQMQRLPETEAAGLVRLRRRTPVGKGRGSSSIDAALAVFGVAWANDLTAHPHEVYQALCRVERSDPAWLAHDLVLAQPEAGLLTILGQQPRFLIVGWDTQPSGTVDTQQATALDKLRRSHESEYQDLLEMVATGEPSLICQAASASSRINHRYLPKPGFEAALKWANDLQAGLLSAHSGTYLALLLPPEAEPDRLGYVVRQVLGLGFSPEFFQMGGPC